MLSPIFHSSSSSSRAASATPSAASPCSTGSPTSPICAPYDARTQPIPIPGSAPIAKDGDFAFAPQRSRSIACVVQKPLRQDSQRLWHLNGLKRPTRKAAKADRPLIRAPQISAAASGVSGAATAQSPPDSPTQPSDSASSCGSAVGSYKAYLGMQATMINSTELLLLAPESVHNNNDNPPGLGDRICYAHLPHTEVTDPELDHGLFYPSGLQGMVFPIEFQTDKMIGEPGGPNELLAESQWQPL